MVQHGFQICGGNVSHNFLPDQREHLVLGGTFQPVVCCPLHRGELENLQPVGQAVFYGFLRFVRVTHFLVELGDVGGNLLLCFRLGFAGEHFAALDSLLVKVPDDALPAAVCAAKNIAVGCQSLFWHEWWFLLPGVCSTTNTTLEGAAMSRRMLRTGRRKTAPPFGGFTPAWGGEFFTGLFFVYAAQILRWPSLAMSRGKRDNFRS